MDSSTRRTRGVQRGPRSHRVVEKVRAATMAELARVGLPGPFTLRTIKSQARPALFAWWLGWTFDGFATDALILVGPAAVSRCA